MGEESAEKKTAGKGNNDLETLDSKEQLAIAKRIIKKDLYEMKISLIFSGRVDLDALVSDKSQALDISEEKLSAFYKGILQEMFYDLFGQ
jgi:hypothetical protein